MELDFNEKHVVLSRSVIEQNKKNHSTIEYLDEYLN
jgi:hypothetical protein